MQHTITTWGRADGGAKAGWLFKLLDPVSAYDSLADAQCPAQDLLCTMDGTAIDRAGRL